MEKWYNIIKYDSRLIDKMEVYAQLEHGYKFHNKTSSNWIVMKNDLGDKIKIGKRKGTRGEDLFTNVYNESINGSILDLAAYHLTGGEIKKDILETHFKNYLNEPLDLKKQKIVKNSNNFLKNKEVKKHYAQTNTNYKKIEDYDFLVNRRKISYQTLNDPIFKERIFNSYYTYSNNGGVAVNTAFPTYANGEIDGLEIRNKPRGLPIQKLISKTDNPKMIAFLEQNKKYKYANKFKDNLILVPKELRTDFEKLFNENKENVALLHHFKQNGENTQGVFVSNTSHLKEIEHLFIGESVLNILSHHEILKASSKSDSYTNCCYVSTGGNVYDEKIKVMLDNIERENITPNTKFYSITDNDPAGIRYDFLISTQLINRFERPLEINIKENLNKHYETISFDVNKITPFEINNIEELVTQYNNNIKIDTNKPLKIETKNVPLRVSDNIIFKSKNEYQDDKIHLQFPKGFDFTNNLYKEILKTLKCQRYYKMHKAINGLNDWNDVLKKIKKKDQTLQLMKSENKKNITNSIKPFKPKLSC